MVYTTLECEQHGWELKWGSWRSFHIFCLPCTLWLTLEIVGRILQDPLKFAHGGDEGGARLLNLQLLRQTTRAQKGPSLLERNDGILPSSSTSLWLLRGVHDEYSPIVLCLLLAWQTLELVVTYSSLVRTTS